MALALVSPFKVGSNSNQAHIRREEVLFSVKDKNTRGCKWQCRFQSLCDEEPKILEVNRCAFILSFSDFSSSPSRSQPHDSVCKFSGPSRVTLSGRVCWEVSGERSSNHITESSNFCNLCNPSGWQHTCRGTWEDLTITGTKQEDQTTRENFRLALGTTSFGCLA